MNDSHYEWRRIKTTDLETMSTGNDSRVIADEGGVKEVKEVFCEIQ